MLGCVLVLDLCLPTGFHTFNGAYNNNNNCKELQRISNARSALHCTISTTKSEHLRRWRIFNDQSAEAPNPQTIPRHRRRYIYGERIEIARKHDTISAIEYCAGNIPALPRKLGVEDSSSILAFEGKDPSGCTYRSFCMP